MENVKRKSEAVTWLRCIAALLIVNSHFGPLYPDGLWALSFGGLFGNCLFMLISGYCFSRINDPFPRWLLKRLIRIYIPYFLFMLLRIQIYDTDEVTVFNLLLPIERYHFIASILTLYPVWYLISWLNKNTKIKYRYILVFLIVVQISYYYLAFDYQSYGLYKHYNLFELLSYTAVMTLGAIMAEGQYLKNPKASAAGVLVAFGVYTFLEFSALPPEFTIVNWYVSAAFGFFLSSFFLSIEDKLPAWKPVTTISTLTLDMYLVQFALIQLYRTYAFPTGYILCAIAIFATAYSLHWLSDKISGFLLKKLTGRPQKT